MHHGVAVVEPFTFSRMKHFGDFLQVYSWMYGKMPTRPCRSSMPSDSPVADQGWHGKSHTYTSQVGIESTGRVVMVLRTNVGVVCDKIRRRAAGSLAHMNCNSVRELITFIAATTDSRPAHSVPRRMGLLVPASLQVNHDDAGLVWQGRLSFLLACNTTVVFLRVCPLAHK